MGKIKRVAPIAAIAILSFMGFLVYGATHNEDIYKTGILSSVFSVPKEKSSQSEPFTIEEYTKYSVSENYVYLTLTDAIDKAQYITNITFTFADSGNTRTVKIDEFFMYHSYQVDVTGDVEKSIGKYKAMEHNCTTENETESCMDYYYDNDGKMMFCEYVLPDKSCIRTVRGIIGEKTGYGYVSTPVVKEKTIIDGLKIEQKVEGSIPLAKGGSAMIKIRMPHMVLYGIYVDEWENKYNITACSQYGCVVLDPDWYDGSWLKATNITITEPNIIGRNSSTGLPHEPIDVPFSPTTKPVNCSKEIRVLNETNGTVDRQVWNETYVDGVCQSCNIVFLINLTKGQSRIFSVYYNNSGASEPSYANRTNFNEYDGNNNDGILSIDGHKRFQMSNGAIRENYGDTDTYTTGLEFETQNVYGWGHEWNDLDNKGTYRIGNDSTGVIDGPIKTTINITNETKFGTATGINYLIDIYAGRQVAFYRFASYCRNSATDTGCGDWAGAAEKNQDVIGYVQAIDNVPPDAIWRRHSDGTVASETGGVDYFINYGFISGDIGSTDIRVLGWQDEGGSTQTDAVGYGNAGNHRPKYRQFSDTWSAADSDGNFTNMTVFYHEINQNVGTQINDSWMAYTNPATTSWGAEQDAPLPPDNPPTYALNSTNGTIAGSDIMHSLNWTDDNALSGYIFQFCDGNWNGSGCEGGVEWCYQESANVSTACGGLDTGVYGFSGTWTNAPNTIDGDWNTEGHLLTSGAYYVNYSKPNGALSSSLWQGKDAQGIRNLSINSNCFDQNILQFKFDASGGENDEAQWFCYNGTDWYRLRLGGSFSGSKLYEEAMWWDISSGEGWTNDTWTSFGAGTWSNVTKTVNSTVGAMVAWCVYANDSADQWNGSSCGELPETPFNYTTTSPVGDTCDYTSGDWEIDCSEYCTIDTETNIENNNLIFYGVGEIYIDANITVGDMHMGTSCIVVFADGKKIVYQ